MSFINELIIFIALLLLSGFFSGSEIALMSLTEARIRALIKKHKTGAHILQKLHKNSSRLLIIILIGNNLINVITAGYATLLATEFFGSAGLGIASGLVTFFILLFGEIIPKTYASKYSVSFALISAYPIYYFSLLILPIAFILEKLTNILFYFTKSHPIFPKISREELHAYVDIGRKEGSIIKRSANIIQNVLDFENIKIKEIMTPAVDIKSIPANKKLSEVIDKIITYKHSHFAVTKDDDPTEIIGQIHIHDLLPYLQNHKTHIRIKKFMRPVKYLPETKLIGDLLADFEKSHEQLIIVVDEYGKTAGLVIMEDIVEEIVGDVFDKTKSSLRYILKASHNTIEASGKATVDDLNNTTFISLAKGDYITIAGYLSNKLGKIPCKGQTIITSDATFDVLDADAKIVKKVRITKNKKPKKS